MMSPGSHVSTSPLPIRSGQATRNGPLPVVFVVVVVVVVVS
jgi:hypothetical protein